MAATDYGICNLALGRIGQRQQITSIDPTVDTSASAALCAIYYPLARDTLLSRWRWGFATEQASLVVAVSPPAASVIPGWTYQYSLPADFLEAQYIFSGARPGAAAAAIIGNSGLYGVTQVSLLPAIDGAVPQVPFEINEGYLFTDWPNAQFVYTGQVTSVPSMPILFQDALAWQLAVDLSLSLSTKPEVAAKAHDMAELAFNRAATAEMNNREPDRRPDSAFVSGRG